MPEKFFIQYSTVNTRACVECLIKLDLTFCWQNVLWHALCVVSSYSVTRGHYSSDKLTCQTHVCYVNCLLPRTEWVIFHSLLQNLTMLQWANSSRSRILILTTEPHVVEFKHLFHFPFNLFQTGWCGFEILWKMKALSYLFKCSLLSLQEQSSVLNQLLSSRKHTVAPLEQNIQS